VDGGAGQCDSSKARDIVNNAGGRFAGRHVVVTGGSSGIGKAVAARVARDGARVTVLARREPVLTAAAEEIAGHAPDGTEAVLALRADVTRAGELSAAMDTAAARFGVPDVLVCSAGIARPDYFDRLTAEDFTAAMDTNYFGTLNAVRAALPAMLAAGRGQLVLVSSGAALVGLFGYGAYGPSKFAVRGLAETLRAELADTPIRVSVVYPPDVDTPQLAEENGTKPPELRAISGSAQVWSADRAAEVIVRGVARGSFVITAGAAMRALVHGHSVLAPVLRWQFDRQARRARRSAEAAAAPTSADDPSPREA
jgi:3-dehydrosphinganine reductase